MITKPIKVVLVIILIMCTQKNIAQNVTSYDVYARRAVVSDTNLLSLLDIMFEQLVECGIDNKYLFFYICESYFDGNNHYYGKALLYETSSYQEMWNNDNLDEADELYWNSYYFYYNDILCICNAEHKNIFSEITNATDKLSLPLNLHQGDPFYLLVVPQISNNQCKYNIYTSCN